METSAAEALFASTCEETVAPPREALRALSDCCVNTSLSGTLFF